jgi:hypothetical protein
MAFHNLSCNFLNVLESKKPNSAFVDNTLGSHEAAANITSDNSIQFLYHAAFIAFSHIQSIIALFLRIWSFIFFMFLNQFLSAYSSQISLIALSIFVASSTLSGAIPLVFQ